MGAEFGVNSRDLNEYGYALCSCCRKKFSLGDLQDKCEFCNRWFCKSCAKPTPAGPVSYTHLTLPTS